MKLIYTYVRESGGPGQERSITDQRNALTAWADAHGYTIGAWYVDEAKSGTLENREQFQQMIADALHHRPYAVAVWDMARFARDMDAAQYYRSLLRRGGVEVLSLNDAIPDGPMGKIVESVIDFSSEHYVATLRANVRRGKRALLSAGYLPGGRVAYGYTEERTLIGTRRDGAPRYGIRWRIDEDAAPLVRQAFQQRGAGLPLAAILEPLPYARKNGLLSMLRSPTYKGEYTYGGIAYPGLVPAIVDAETWARAQVALPLSPRTLGSDYLLTGLLRCGYCGGAALVGSTKTTERGSQHWRKRYYICTVRMHGRVGACPAPMLHADPLEQDIVAEVLDAFLAPDAFARFVAEVRAQEGQDTHAARRAGLARRIEQTERALLDLADLAGRGLAVDVIAAKLQTREGELRELRAQLASLPQTRPMLQKSEAELRAYIVGLRDRLTAGDVAVKRFVLHEIIESIIVGPDGVEVNYKLPE